MEQTGSKDRWPQDRPEQQVSQQEPETEALPVPRFLPMALGLARREQSEPARRERVLERESELSLLPVARPAPGSSD